MNDRSRTGTKNNCRDLTKSCAHCAAERDVEAEKTYLQSFVNGGLARLKNLEPKVLVEQDLSLDGHAGKFMKVETSDGMVVRSKYFAVKNRLYIAYAISKKGDRHGFNWENDFEIPAMAFLDSIRLASAK